MGKSRFSLMMNLWFGASLLITVVWFMFDIKYNGPYLLDFQKKITPRTFDLCNGCKKVLQEILQDYNIIWQRHQDNQQEFRSLLRSKCHGFERAFVTKENYPVGSNLSYDWQRKTIQVNPDLYSTFIEEHPFSEKTWEECAVVGNGGILSNSSCGDMIDSAQFVIRCNLPPLRDGYEKHVGSKTNLVTANPTILRQQYGSLMNRRGPFMERLGPYGSSLLLLPAFSFGYDTSTCQRAAYAIEDLGSPIRPVYYNPEYIRNLTHFWRTQGLGGRRLSSGIVMVSLALEVCENVHLYGFWPFGFHPFELHNLTHHYYDDVAAKKGVHAMPAEFKHFLKLHSQGVLNLHLGDCQPGMT